MFTVAVTFVWAGALFEKNVFFRLFQTAGIGILHIL